MKKFWIQFSILCVIIFGALYVTFNRNLLFPFLPNSGSTTTPTVSGNKLKVGNAILDIEVADSSAERAQGLSDRDSLDPNSGMLFVFPEEKRYQFWMKGMRINLDMIFIKNGLVVDLLTNVPKPQEGQKDADLSIYEPVTEIDMLLEVNSGFIQRHGIKVGDSVNLVE